MDPRRLLTFRTVAHQRSFSRAAALLSITQPSVSHQIALLETEIGTRLLHRGHGGLTLTDAGSVLLEHADDIAWRLDLASTQLAELTELHRRHIRVGAFPTALGSLIPAAVLGLRNGHPDLRTQLSELTAEHVAPRLLSGEIDVAVAYQDSATPRREIPGTERIDLAQETFFIALPREHRLAHAEAPLSLTDLAEEDWILPSADGFLVQACRDAGFDPRVVALCAEPLATHGLISRGLGIGWVAGLLRADYSETVLRTVTEPTRRRDIYAVLPPGNRHPLARALVRALINAAREIDGRDARDRREPRHVGRHDAVD